MDIEIVKGYCLDILKRIDDAAYVYTTKDTYTILAIGNKFALLYDISSPKVVEIRWYLNYSKKLNLSDQMIEDEIISIYRQVYEHKMS